MVTVSAIIPHFQKCFTDYGMGLYTVLKKSARIFSNFNDHEYYSNSLLCI